MIAELWLMLFGFVIIAAMVFVEYFRRGFQSLARYRSAVRFQLGTGRQQMFNQRRVRRFWRASVTPQNAAWLLLNENRRSSDKV